MKRVKITKTTRLGDPSGNMRTPLVNVTAGKTADLEDRYADRVVELGFGDFTEDQPEDQVVDADQPDAAVDAADADDADADADQVEVQVEVEDKNHDGGSSKREGKRERNGLFGKGGRGGSYGKGKGDRGGKGSQVLE